MINCAGYFDGRPCYNGIDLTAEVQRQQAIIDRQIMWGCDVCGTYQVKRFNNNELNRLRNMDP